MNLSTCSLLFVRHDGQPACKISPVKQSLIKTFGNQIFGYGVVEVQLPRSPDMTPLFSTRKILMWFYSIVHGYFDMPRYRFYEYNDYRSKFITAGRGSVPDIKDFLRRNKIALFGIAIRTKIRLEYLGHYQQQKWYEVHGLKKQITQFVNKQTKKSFAYPPHWWESSVAVSK
ncbi:hypothetical protein TNCV_3623151 [Trichonephila clavipes]|nr:hypothetical protein TNCV_3623151 [Trichonephila clavipes]